MTAARPSRRGKYRDADRGRQGLPVVRVHRAHTSEAALPIITKANIPFFEPPPEAKHPRRVHKNVFNVSASYKLETLALVNYL